MSTTSVAAGAQPAKLAHSVFEAADLLGISRSSVYELISTGQLRSVRVGGRRLIPHDALVELLAGEDR